MTLNDINQAKQEIADTELHLAYIVAEAIETLKNSGCTVLDLSNVYVLDVAIGSNKVGRTILFNEPQKTV